MTTRELLCCCGRACDNTAHNYTVLEELERDVHEAGTIGQTLLQRYEGHVAQSSREREKLLLAMESLENNKSALEASNAKIIVENRALLDQLEGLNSAIAESDLHISTLNETLDVTRQELQKLGSLAQKATQLERELTSLESERAQLDIELASSREDKQAATQRWRRAESTIVFLQNQIDMMDQDAIDQSQKNKQTETCMVRLDKTAGGMPSAHPPYDTDTSSTSREKSTKSDGMVISHFVKEILEDNSNLQLGLLELKEMFLESSSEVKTLRARLDLDAETSEDSRLPMKSLQAELYESSDGGGKLETVPELHVHHHYHQPKQNSRRPRRRRFNQTFMLSNRSGTSALPKDNHDATNATDYDGSASADQPSASGYVGHYPRSSVYSARTESSYAASTFSTSPRGFPSIFDSVENVFDSTRATTPASSAPGSPLLPAHHEQSFELRQEMAYGIRQARTPPSHQSDASSAMAGAILRARESHSANITKSDLHQSHGPEAVINARLRRASSQNSLISISGMDIHTTQKRHTRMQACPALLLNTGRLPPTSTSITLSAATAVPQLFDLGMSNEGESSASLLRHQMRARGHDQEASSLRRMGDWVFGKRGRDTLSTDSTDNSGSVIGEEDASLEKDHAAGFRSPGINQPGPIFGMLKPQPAPINVRPTDIDSSLLKETLLGNL